MASVRLEREEAEGGDLPSVCMCCGAPATVQVNKKFHWHPPWVALLLLAGLLPYLIVALILTQRMRVPVPMCHAHRGHWTNRTLLALGSFVALIALVVGGVIFMSDLARQAGGRNDWGGLVCAGLAGLLLGWLILILVLHYTSIHTTEITERTLTLTGVSPEFTKAVEAGRDVERYRASRSDYYGEAAKHFRPGERRPDPMPPDAYREGDPPPQ